MRLRLTRNGIVATTAVPALLAAGRFLGLTELFILAATLATAVIAAVVWVRVRRPDFRIQRVARPARVPCGGTCHVALTIANAGRRTPVVHIRDRVQGLGDARLRVAPLGRGTQREALYDLPTSRRGVLTIGPLTVEVEDPFALATGRFTLRRTTAVIVLPRIVPLTPLPAAPGEGGERPLSSFRSMSTMDEEFVGLRAYVQGDDVRRIHWPSTARSRTPIIRQYDRPWQRRTAVVLDLRASRHTEESFERAVSAAASALAVGVEHGELVRLVTTDGVDSGFVAGEAALDDLLDRLAEVTPRGTGRLEGAYRLLGTRDTGRVVSCLGKPGPGDDAVVTAVPATLHVVIATLGAAPASNGVLVGINDDGAVPLEDHWRTMLAGSPGRVA